MTFILALGCGSSGPMKEMERELKEIKLLATGLRVRKCEIKSLDLLAAKGLCAF